MENREFKDKVFQGLSKLLKALSNPFRLEIIEIISQGEKSVEGIVKATNLSIANASQHLQVLKNNNVVKTRKEKQYVYYSLVNDDFLVLYQHITRYALSEIAELEKILNRQRKDNMALNAVSLEDLGAMLRDDNVLLIDVRPSIEYQFGHITNAVSIPINDLLSKLKDLSKSKEIIAYCRGPFCVLADQAVKILHEQGYKVRRLDQGYPEWKMKQIESTQSN